jgi:hypothetical protein
LAAKFQTALHVSHAAFPAPIAKFQPEHSPLNVINYFLTFNETENSFQVLKNVLLLHTQTAQFPQLLPSSLPTNLHCY